MISFTCTVLVNLPRGKLRFRMVFCFKNNISRLSNFPTRFYASSIVKAAMPGLTADSSHRRAVKATAAIDPSYQSWTTPRSHILSTTAYGLNEPQWSAGPPPLTFELSPYARVPLPPLPPTNLHPLLHCPDHLNSPSPIRWSVTQPHSSARLSSSLSYTNAYHWKALPALNPSRRSLTIRTASTPSFSRPIVVFPNSIHSEVMTIGDTLNAIYTGLRQCANDILCENLGIVPSLLSEQLFHGSAGLSYTTTQTTGGGDDEVSTRLAECLDFKIQWVGLVPSNRERDVFILHTKALVPR